MTNQFAAKISEPETEQLSRKVSPILLRYVSREFLVPLLCCAGGFMVLFVIVDVFEYLKDFLTAQAGLGVAARYFFYRQPYNLVNVLPMSILLSVSFMMNILGRHHEITAMRAAGLSIIRFAVPVWIIAVLFTLITFWVSERVVPDFNTRAKWLLNSVVDGATVQAHTRLAYRNSNANRDWFFEEFQRHGHQAGVLVKQFRADRTVEWELRAEKAQYRDGQWVFENGILSRLDRLGEWPEGPLQPFENIQMPQLHETPADIFNSLRPAEELPVMEIWSLLRRHSNLPQTTKDILRTIGWYRISFPLACIIAALLGIALTAVQERSNAMHGFAMSVGLMVLYYVTAQLFVLLGKSGWLPPVLAGMLPTTGFIAWGVWAVYHNR